MANAMEKIKREIAGSVGKNYDIVAKRGRKKGGFGKLHVRLGISEHFCGKAHRQTHKRRLQHVLFLY